MDPKTIEKFLRREQEHEQRGEFLATARAEMEKTGEVVSLARGLYTLPGHSCLAQYPVLDPSTAAASPVTSVPNVPTAPTTPDPANDQNTNSHATPVSNVSNVSTVPSATSTPPTPIARQTHLTASDESAGARKSDPDQQPENP